MWRRVVRHHLCGRQGHGPAPFTVGVGSGGRARLQYSAARSKRKTGTLSPRPGPFASQELHQL